MSVQARVSYAGEAQADAERLPVAWWLWLPLAVGALLLAWAKVDPDSHEIWIEPERGLLEAAHFLITLAVFLLALPMLRWPVVRARGLLFAWVIAIAAGTFYIAGEEVSWGQHILGWATPEYWASVNDQQETNLHNVSSWFDQKPRFLLEIGIIVGGILVPIAALRRPRIRAGRFGIFLPPLICLPAAVLAELVRLEDRFRDGGQAFLFPRSSEVQEFYFYLFMLLYIVVLRRRLRLAPIDRRGASRR